MNMLGVVGVVEGRGSRMRRSCEDRVPWGAIYRETLREGFRWRAEEQLVTVDGDAAPSVMDRAFVMDHVLGFGEERSVSAREQAWARFVEVSGITPMWRTGRGDGKSLYEAGEVLRALGEATKKGRERVGHGDAEREKFVRERVG